MSLRFLGLADGRLARALPAVRKLLSLGFGVREFAILVRWVRRQRSPVPRAVRRAGSRADQRARRRVAQCAIRTMMIMGFSESEIAAFAGVRASSIAHVLNPCELRGVGEDTVARLKRFVETAGAERLKVLLPQIPITVLDTCCNKGVDVDGHSAKELTQSVQTVLRNVLTLSSLPTPLSCDVSAILAQVGEPVHGTYVIVAPFVGPNSLEGRLAQLRRVEHEASHLVGRVRVEREELEWRLRQQRDRDVPSDGGIA